MSVNENEDTLLDNKDLNADSETSRWVSEVTTDYITHNPRASKSQMWL